MSFCFACCSSYYSTPVYTWMSFCFSSYYSTPVYTWMSFCFACCSTYIPGWVSVSPVAVVIILHLYIPGWVSISPVALPIYLDVFLFHLLHYVYTWMSFYFTCCTTYIPGWVSVLPVAVVIILQPYIPGWVSVLPVAVVIILQLYIPGWVSVSPVALRIRLDEFLFHLLQYIYTWMSFCFACCSSSCSRPVKNDKPTGTSLLRQATFRLLWGSSRLFLSRFFKPGCRFVPDDDPSCVASILDTERCLDWPGIISAMLSISLWATKFCSSLINIYNGFVTKFWYIKLFLTGILQTYK